MLGEFTAYERLTLPNHPNDPPHAVPQVIRPKALTTPKQTLPQVMSRTTAELAVAAQRPMVAAACQLVTSPVGGTSQHQSAVPVGSGALSPVGDQRWRRLITGSRHKLAALRCGVGGVSAASSPAVHRQWLRRKSPSGVPGLRSVATGHTGPRRPGRGRWSYRATEAREGTQRDQRATGHTGQAETDHQSY